jgi:hypothetical protein
MSEQAKVLRLEGVVHLRDIYLSPRLGAELESSDARWEIADSYEGSPYQAFAERRVVVSGVPYKSKSMQRHLWRVGEKPIRHFRVSTMRLIEVTPDAEIMEVGTGQQLTGRFELDTSDTGKSKLSFVTEQGVAFVATTQPERGHFTATCLACVSKKTASLHWS